MAGYITIFNAIAPVFIIIITGFVLRRLNVLSQDADRSLMRMIFWILYPSLILNYILGNEALNDFGNLTMAPLMGFVCLMLGFLVGAIAARIFRYKSAKKRQTFSFISGTFNYGFIPIPLISSLFHCKATIGVLLVFNVAVEGTLWGIGLLVLTGSFNRNAWKKILNPVVIALIVGMSFNLTGHDISIPSIITQTIELLAGCAVPIGLLLSGATIADLIEEQGFPTDIRGWGAGCLIRILILPIFFLRLAYFIPCSDDLKRVLIVQASMPAALMPIVITRFYGGDTRIAVQVVIGTTLVSLFTIPLWISLGLKLIPVG